MLYLTVSIPEEVQDKHPPVGNHLEHQVVVVDKHPLEVADKHPLAVVDKHLVDKHLLVVVSLSQVVRYLSDTVQSVAEGNLLNITQLHT